jgi:pyridoxal phosphate enzyme (YggS family)|tara:strand:- start:5526 stop:6188 length:663 start_codon:yes stop_codon:yes gene_type:complete
MHKNLQSLKNIEIKIKEIIGITQQKTLPQIIAVTKTFTLKDFESLLDNDHKHFGENKLQEAEKKWEEIKKNYKDLKLHMLGKLQSNKAKKAISLFDYIHSLDNERLAKKLNDHQNELNKKIKYFIQVNIADEPQKSGVTLNSLNSFYNFCTNELSLDVIGLMCLPPANDDPNSYFKLLKDNADKLNLHHLSIGMSGDYKEAINNGATYLRLGSAIFGART